jgi:hypothetical protein
MPALPNALRSFAVAALGVAAAVGSAQGQSVPGSGGYLPAPAHIESRLIAPEQGGDVVRSPAPSPSRQIVAIPATLPPAQSVASVPPPAVAPPVAAVPPAPAYVEPTIAAPPPAAAPEPRPAATAALAPEPAAPAPSGPVVSSVPFMPGSAILSDGAKAELDRVAANIADRKLRGVELHAFAGDGDPDSRKIALARALVVRSYLIDRRVKARIEVGAFSGSGERVDVLVPTL